MPVFARRLVAPLLGITAAIAVFPPIGVAATPQAERITVFFAQEQTPLAVADFATRYAIVPVPELPEEEAMLFTFSTEEPENVLAEIRRDPLVLAASRVDVVRAQTYDPLYSEQWWLKNNGQNFAVGFLHIILEATGLDDFFEFFPATAGKDIRWEEAAALPVCAGGSCIGQGVIVAVVDSGIDSTHPDIAGRVSVRSKSYVSGFAPTEDDAGHGTFVAGLIGANSNNGLGITGVAPGASLLALKTLYLDADGGIVGNSDATAAAILYAADEGANVINLSLGSTTANSVTKAAIDRVTQAPYNVIVVAAAGNSGDDGNPVIYPAAFPHVTSVASVNSDGQHTAFSQRNEFVDVAAPGGMVFSLFADSAFDGVDCRLAGTPYSTVEFSASYADPYDCLFTDGTRTDVGYMSGSGTSFAAPLVAGAAALAKQKWPSITPDQFETLVRATADDDPSGNGPDPSYGAGTLNIQRLLSFNFPPSIDADLIGLTAPVVTNAGTDTTAVVVRVSNMEGSSDLAAVTADFSALGVAQPVTMTPSADLTYESSPQVIPASVAEGQYDITVTARDAAGAAASATTHLQVLPSGSVVPSLPGGGVNFGAPAPTLDVAVAISTPEKRKVVTRKKALALSGTIGGNVAAVEVNGEPASINAAAKTWSARTSLKRGKNRIEVTSFDVTRAASETATLDAVLDRTAPGTVKNLRAEPAGSKTLLRWDAPADKDVAGYHVYSLASGGRKAIATSRKTSATVEGQGPFAVAAEDEAGNEGDVSSAPSAGAATTFSDLPANHFAAPAVASLLVRGIFQPADRFRPDDAITRAEFAKLLILARGERGSAPTSFRDVPASFSLAEYVGAIVRLGWAAGQGDQFFPMRPISRIEAARMLVSALRLKPADSPTFTDVPNASERGVAAAVARAGIVAGQGSLFMPHRTLTRAEAAKVIAAVLQ